jgi:hypothetical protein
MSADRTSRAKARKLVKSLTIITILLVTVAIVIQTTKAGNLLRCQPFTWLQLSPLVLVFTCIHTLPDQIAIILDFVVLGSPISDELVSSTELGLFKYHVKKGIFLAPKSYLLDTEEVGEIMKHKGATKDSMTADWFQKLYDNPSIMNQMSIDTDFRIDWKKPSIGKKSMIFRLGGLSQCTKRDNVYDANGNWVGTCPKNVI